MLFICRLIYIVIIIFSYAFATRHGSHTRMYCIDNLILGWFAVPAALCRSKTLPFLCDYLYMYWRGYSGELTMFDLLNNFWCTIQLLIKLENILYKDQWKSTWGSATPDCSYYTAMYVLIINVIWIHFTMKKETQACLHKKVGLLSDL